MKTGNITTDLHFLEAVFNYTQLNITSLGDWLLNLKEQFSMLTVSPTTGVPPRRTQWLPAIPVTNQGNVPWIPTRKNWRNNLPFSIFFTLYCVILIITFRRCPYLVCTKGISAEMTFTWQHPLGIRNQDPRTIFLFFLE